MDQFWTFGLPPTVQHIRHLCLTYCNHGSFTARFACTYVRISASGDTAHRGTFRSFCRLPLPLLFSILAFGSGSCPLRQPVGDARAASVPSPWRTLLLCATTAEHYPTLCTHLPVARSPPYHPLTYTAHLNFPMGCSSPPSISFHASSSGKEEKTAPLLLFLFMPTTPAFCCYTLHTATHTHTPSSGLSMGSYTSHCTFPPPPPPPPTNTPLSGFAVVMPHICRGLAWGRAVKIHAVPSLCLPG